ncbi:MAG: HlyD family efflux transporter periplasmic adaptor subunit [Lentisphaerae bacterium]|nr:HlyD family efflux transporter periplasmic adaptor subunit [Lentisphaerota bacterium]
MKRIHIALALAMIGIGCSRNAARPVQGYVEAEYHYPAAPFGGRLIERPVMRGQRVSAGQALATLDMAEENLQAAQLADRLDQAAARLADTRKGQRPAELAAVEAQVAQFTAALELSKLDVDRRRALIEKGVIAQAEWDQARLAHEQNQQALEQARSHLETARLGARADLIAAAESDWRAVSNQLAEAVWRRDQKQINAPCAGVVHDTYYETGDWVPAGRPVVALLPPDQLKVRFYLPATALAQQRVGAPVQVRTDGAGDDIAATICYISASPEYTPPVIYSRDRRDKLVFLVEARLPPEAAPRVHPGQPVEIHIDSAANERE